jgi:hypothetical protein
MNNTGLLINNTDETVTYQHRITDTNNLHHLNVETVVGLIRSGGNYKSTIMDVRTALSSSDKKAADLFKKQLPAVLFSGKFSSACRSGLVAHSGLLVVDFDDVPSDEIQDYKQELADHPSTRLVFISPSGSGLKWVVAVSATDEATHKQCFELCIREVTKRYPSLSERLDKACSDVSRRCFMSYDPEVVVRTPTEWIGVKPPPSAECDIGNQGSKESKEYKEYELNRIFSRDLPLKDRSPNSAPPPQEELTLHARVEKLVAKQKHENHFSLFQLARLCRDLEAEKGLARGQLPREVRMDLFQLWLKLTPSDLQRHDEGDYFDEFTSAFHDARLGLNCVPWREAWEESRTEAPPDWWKLVIEYPETKRLRMLTMLVIQARITGGQVIAPRHEIALTANKEGVTALDHPEKVQRVLDGFRPILEIVSKGCQRSGLASVYRLKVPAPIPELVEKAREAISL